MPAARRCYRRQSTPRVCCIWSLCLYLSIAGVAAEGAAIATEASDARLPDLRFHVPFPVVNVEQLDLESHTISPPDLRVKRKLTRDQTKSTPACDAATNEDAVPPAFASAQPSDRLVSVDGVAISLQPFHEVVDLPLGTTVMLPLFKSKGEGNILTGFARVEIVRPQSVEFQPTTAERATEIQLWQEAVAAAAQRQRDREQQARELEAAAENDQLEREAREQHERDEQYRLEMTPHEKVSGKRMEGREFRYEVVFTTRGPIGLNWDLLVDDKTVVSYVEPKLAAESVGVIMAKDQLVQLNDVDTSRMGPAQVVQTYVASAPPRRLVFRCADSAAKTASAAAGFVQEKRQNWTMVFESPTILRGWHTRLHLATWSLEPETLASQNLTLVAAKPITGCQPLEDARGDASVYLSYRGACSFVEKAERAISSRARALVVVNNVKGLGRFPGKMPEVANVNLPVLMIGKLDGELLMSVLEYESEEVRFYIREEDPSVAMALQTPPVLPPKLTNQEMAFRRDPKKASRSLTFWYINTTSGGRSLAEFHVLPALFGGNITASPYRIVMAHPQDTACHPQGLGVLATQSVILVKRGGCSFGAKAKSVQTVGGAGMLLINSDESLLPLMSDPKETTDLTIWAASISLSNGTFLETRLAQNRNLPSLVQASSTPLTS